MNSFDIIRYVYYYYDNINHDEETVAMATFSMIY